MAQKNNTQVSNMAGAKRSITLKPAAEDPRVLPAAQKLCDFCQAHNMNIQVHIAEKCVLHLLYVLQANHHINLTSITDFDKALILHTFDSLTFLPYVSKRDEQILDMGTGAGFPGIPLALAQQKPVLLVDSVQKKMAVVDTIIGTLGIKNAKTARARLEDIPVQHPARFDCVVARALAPLPTLLEYGRPLLRKTGRIVLSKGTPDAEEMAAGECVADVLGLSLAERKTFNLPFDYGKRTILVYKAERSAKIKLPRKPGEAKRNPLA